jgi:predicted nuclease of restriction endonuclease-like (RecB) superfamily
LTWSHYFEIVKADSDLEISFYCKQSEIEKWSVRELKGQMKSSLFERITLSKDKKGVLEVAKNGQIIEKTEDIINKP